MWSIHVRWQCSPGADPHEQTRRERDLYKRLLELGHHRHIGPFLEESLELLIQLVGAARGSLELRDRSGDPSLLISRGFDPADRIRGFSRSVVAEAFATGQTIVTASAQIDPRFSSSCSVRSHALEAVLCVPFGDPSLGIVYLQDRPQPGPFTQEDCDRVEMFARQIAVFADRLRRLGRAASTTAAIPPANTGAACGAIRWWGASPAMAELLKQVAMVAPLQISVLITGPSGSGKTQLARLIHDNSRRATGPFIELNCGALPGELIENELYGSVPGAHSTAAKRTEGKVAAAEGGTLFLDEVGELPVRAQASLLQLLQSRSYFPLGSAAARTSQRPHPGGDQHQPGRRRDGAPVSRGPVLPAQRVPAAGAQPGREPRRHSAAGRTLLPAGQPQQRSARAAAGRRALAALEDAEWPGEIRELAHAVEVGVVRGPRRWGGAGRAAAPVLTTGPRWRRFPGQRAGSRRRRAARRQPGRGNAAGSDPQASSASWCGRPCCAPGATSTAAARQLQVTRTHMYNLMSSLGIRRKRPNTQGT